MNERNLPNGSGVAAVLSAGIGCFALGVLALLGDKSPLIRSYFVFYRPTGPVSGVSTCAIITWILTWGTLEWRWRKKTVAARTLVAVAFVIFALGMVLTFPPVVDLF